MADRCGVGRRAILLTDRGICSRADAENAIRNRRGGWASLRTGPSSAGIRVHLIWLGNEISKRVEMAYLQRPDANARLSAR